MNNVSNLGLANGFAQGFSLMNNYQAGKESRERADKEFQHKEQEWDREEAARLTQAMYQGVMDDNVDPELAKQWEAKTGPIDWTGIVDPQYGKDLYFMKAAVEGKASINSPEGLAAFNRIYKKDVKRGVGEKVGNKTIVDKAVNRIIPSKDGKSFMLNLAVKEEDPEAGWSVRNAPVTANRSASDTEVKQVDLDTALGDLKGKLMIYEGIQKSPKILSLLKQRAAKLGAQLPQAQQPIEVNGQLVDPSTYEVVGDYRNPQKEPGPIVTGGGLVLSADGTKQLGDYRQQKTERPIVTAGGLVLSPDGTKQIADYRKPGGAGGSSGQPLREKRLVEWLLADGIAADPKQAWNMINTSKTDPIKFVSGYAEMKVAQQESARIRPGNPEYRTIDEFMEDGMKAHRAIKKQMDESEQQGGLQNVGDQAQGTVDRSNPVSQPTGSIQATHEIKTVSAPPPEALQELNNQLSRAQSPQERETIKAQFQEYFMLPEGL